MEDSTLHLGWGVACGCGEVGQFSGQGCTFGRRLSEQGENARPKRRRQAPRVTEFASHGDSVCAYGTHAIGVMGPEDTGIGRHGLDSEAADSRPQSRKGIFEEPEDLSVDPPLEADASRSDGSPGKPVGVTLLTSDLGSRHERSS